jgi:broad specificity phosphatase PhoE
MCSLDAGLSCRSACVPHTAGLCGRQATVDGPDVERPLDAAGIAQAEALADELAVLPIHRESTV